MTTSVAPVSPALAGARTAEKKAERKPFMKEYKSLSAEEVDSIVAYMMTLKK